MASSEEETETSADIIPFAIETDASRRPSTSESLELIKAFLDVSDPAERRRILENVQQSAARCRANHL